MKQTILLAIISVLIMVLSASCSSGVSQEQYKKATDDLAAAQTQAQSLQTQTQTLQTQNQALQSQTQTLQAQNQALQSQTQTLQTQNQALQTQTQTLQTQTQSLQTQLQSLQSQTQSSQGDKAALADLQKKISQTKPYWQLFTSFYQIGITGQTPSAAQIIDLMAKIQATGDTVLTGKMQSLITSGGGTKESLDFVDYLISKISDLLK